MTAWWLIVAGLVGTPDPDPRTDAKVSALVERLTAPRRADRERAAKDLIAIGDAARAALRNAVGSRDLERKAQAAGVLDAIEGRHLGNPKLFTLDFRDRPVSEVVDAIADRSGEGLVLQPGADPKRGDLKITLVAEGGVSFWDAVDRLAKEAKLVRDTNPNFGWNNRGMMGGGFNPAPRPRRPVTGQEVMLVPAAGVTPAPTVRSGRFEISVMNIHHQRDMNLGAAGGRRPFETLTDRFEVRLRVTPEPSLTLGKVGDVQGLEAVDDLGRSLVPESPVAEPESNQVGMMNGFRAYPDQNTALSIRLRYPDKPGSTIRRLKGTFAVTVVGTKSDAVSASLVSALNVPVHKEGVTLTIHGVTTPPAMPAVRLVELSMIRPETAGQSQNGMASFNRTVNVVPNSAQGWLQFVDAEGRQVERVAVTPFNIADGNHRSVQFNQLPGVGMAVAVRYLTPIWATLDVPFDFHDLPMP